MTVREALTLGSAELKAAGIGTPNLDASLLLAYILNTNRAALIARGTDTLTEKTLIDFRDLLNRRLKGECVAYITGKKEFFGLDFLVNSSVLVPRPDTEILVEAALGVLGTKDWGLETGVCPVLDLCTGSGVIAVALKHKMPHLEVYATDISPEALETAKANAKNLLPVKSHIYFHKGDLYDALSSSAFQFSLIVSNPPYIPSDEITTLSAEVQNEPHLALDGGVSGLEIIKRIIEGAPKFLVKNGALLIEADPRQMESITILLKGRGFQKIAIHKDLSGQKRIISGTMPAD